MPRPPIALQLYSVRDEAARDLPGTLAKVAAMGYEGVEFAGFHGHEPRAIKAILDEHELLAAGTHTGIDALADDRIEDTIAAHKILGTPFVIIPWMPVEKRNSVAALAETTAELTRLTRRLADEGLRLGFHAHGDDMHPVEGGEGAYYRIARGTPTEFVLQYDTSNGVDGGADPVQPLLDFPGRSGSVHLKETDGKDIGEGRVPWSRVLEVAANAQWWVIEHEAATGPDGLAAVERGLRNLRSLPV